MKPYPFTSNRFDVDAYLDRQLDKSRSAEAERMIARYPFVITDGQPSQSRFRGWALRLNARCERLLDRTDWPRVDMVLGTVGGFVFTGVVVWFLYVCADAWLQGRFNLGAN